MCRICFLVACLLVGCASLNTPNSYKYLIFEVPSGAHQLNPILQSEYREGSFEIIPVDNHLKPKGDTLRAWVEHFAPGSSLNETQARYADLLIMCYPDYLPSWATSKHVFPWHEGQIFLYTISEDIIVVSTERIDTFDLVLEANTRMMSELMNK